MSAKDTICKVDDKVAVGIASGLSLSEPVNCGGLRAQGLVMPEGWTPAVLTVLASLDGVNFSPLYDGQGNEYAIAADASRYVILDPAVFTALRLFRLRSGTASAPVAQDADRILTVNLA